MIIFVATSKRFYGEAIKLVNHLKDTRVKVHHPYFDLNPEEVDADPELKSKGRLTWQALRTYLLKWPA